jgi:hypothetical protein
MHKILFWMGTDHLNKYAIFSEFLDATEGLPIGQSRLQWDPAALRKVDERLDSISAHYHLRIVDACQRILQLEDSAEKA